MQNCFQIPNYEIESMPNKYKVRTSKNVFISLEDSLGRVVTITNTITDMLLHII